MEKNVKIEIPDGYDDAVYNKETKTIEFVKTDKRPKTWQEYKDKHSAGDVKSVQFIVTDGQVYVERILDKFPISGNENLKLDAYVALYKLVLLRNEWVKGTADNHYAIMRNELNDFTPYRCDYSKHLLEFPTYRMAEEFIKYFKGLLIVAKPLI